MATCKHCGATYEEELNFCRQCGAPLASKSTPSRAQEIIEKRRDFDTRIAEHPDDAALRLEYGQFLAEAGLATEAIPMLKAALDLDPGNTECARELLGACRTKGDGDGVVNALKRLVEQEPRDTCLLVELMDELLALGRREEAEAVLMRILDAPASDANLLRSLFEKWHTIGTPQLVITLCRKILEADPSNLHAGACLGDLLWDLGEKDNAAAAYEQLLKADANHARAHLRIALAAHVPPRQDITGDRDAVRRHLAAAIQNADRLSTDENTLAKVLFLHADIRSGTADAAACDALRDIQPATIESVYRQVVQNCLIFAGDRHVDSGNPERALSFYEAALQWGAADEVTAKLANVYRLCGDKALDAGKRSPATKFYRMSLKHCPEQPGVAERLATLQKGRTRTSIKVFSAVAVLVVGAGLGILFYLFGQGAYEIVVSPDADAITVLNTFGKVVADGSGETLTTPAMRFGRHTITVEKAGYHPFVMRLWGPFGNKPGPVAITLEQQYGSIAVNSEPPGATVVINNHSQSYEDTTPCVITDVLAVVCDIRITYPGCPPVIMQEEVLPDETLDLGTVSFFGALQVDTNPSGAEIRIGDEVKGVTPARIEGLLATKTRVILQKEGVGVFVAEAEIAPGETTDFGTIDIEHLSALVVDSEPSGMPVLLDEEQVGLTPLVLNDAGAGERNLRVAPHGLVPFERTVTLTPGELVDLGLVTFTGGLRCDSEPSGADVYIDGEPRGVTPLTVDGLPARPTEVSFRLPGKGVHSLTAMVEPEQTLDLGTVVLQAFSGVWHGTLRGGRTRMTLYLKERGDGTVVGAGWVYGDNFWELFEGTVNDMSLLLRAHSLSPVEKRINRAEFSTFSLDLSDTGRELTGKWMRGNDTHECTLTRDANDAHTLRVNPDMQYWVQVANNNVDGMIRVNGLRVLLAPEGATSSWLDLTPWMQDGLNRVRFTTTARRSGAMEVSAAIKRVRSDGTEEPVWEAEERIEATRQQSAQYSRSIVIPYFAGADGLAAWREKRGDAPFLNETLISPSASAASSLFSADTSASQAHDHSLDTGWVSGREDVVGAWLHLSFDGEHTIHGVRLFGGVPENLRVVGYARIRRATVSINGRETTLDCANTTNEQFFLLEPVSASELTLTVDEVYPGERVNVIGIREIQAVQFSVEADESDYTIPLEEEILPEEEVDKEEIAGDDGEVKERPPEPPAPVATCKPPKTLAPGRAETPGETLNTATPTFQWTPVGDRCTLNLYISRAPYGEQNIVFRKDGMPGSAQTFQLPNETKLADGQYRWNMEVFEQGRSQGYSERRYFRVTTRAATPAPPPPPPTVEVPPPVSTHIPPPGPQQDTTQPPAEPRPTISEGLDTVRDVVDTIGEIQRIIPPRRRR